MRTYQSRTLDVYANFTQQTRDTEAVEYFLLPLPAASYKVSRCRVCFSFFFKALPIPLPQKFNRFHCLCFHIPSSCFMKNSSAYGSSKSQMLPSLLPASFIKVLPLSAPLPHLTASTASAFSSLLQTLRVAIRRRFTNLYSVSESSFSFSFFFNDSLQLIDLLRRTILASC